MFMPAGGKRHKIVNGFLCLCLVGGVGGGVVVVVVVLVVGGVGGGGGAVGSFTSRKHWLQHLCLLTQDASQAFCERQNFQRCCL